MAITHVSDRSDHRLLFDYRAARIVRATLIILFFFYGAMSLGEAANVLADSHAYEVLWGCDGCSLPWYLSSRGAYIGTAGLMGMIGLGLAWVLIWTIEEKKWRH